MLGGYGRRSQPGGQVDRWLLKEGGINVYLEHDGSVLR